MQVAAFGQANDTCPDGTKPSEHCQENCRIRNLEPDCTISAKILDSIQYRLKSTGTSDHPRWSFNYTTSKRGVEPPELHEVTVECPCSASDGQTLDEETALRNILGQIATVGVPKVIAERVAAGETKADMFMVQMSYAVTRMMSCWGTNCKGPSRCMRVVRVSCRSEERRVRERVCVPV